MNIKVNLRKRVHKTFAQIKSAKLLGLTKISSLLMLGLLVVSFFGGGVLVLGQNIGTSIDSLPDTTQSSFRAYPTYDVSVNKDNNKTWNQNPNFAQVECYGTVCRIPKNDGGYQYATGCLNVGTTGLGGVTSGSGTKVQCASEINTSFSTNNPTVGELKQATTTVINEITSTVDLSWSSQEVFTDIVEGEGGTTFSGGKKVTAECSIINKDQGTKVCRVKNSDNTYKYYYSCTDRGNTAQGGKDFSCGKTSTFTGDAKKISDLGLSATDLTVASVDAKLAGETPKEVTNPLNELIKVLLDFVAAIVLIFVYLASWFATLVLWMVSFVFLVIVQINPASSEFLSVATEPWQIVVSIANLLILFSFIYLGFGYLLGVKSITKNNKWESFVTNILIIGVTVNLSLFACAAFINFTHGIGDTFIGAYTTTSGRTKSDAIIGDFMSNIKQLSYIRCGAVNVTEGGKPATGGKECDTNQFGEIGRLGGTVGGGLNVGFNLFASLFGKKAGGTVAITSGEIVYLIVIIYAIMQMWRAMFLALLRVVGLWLLMVASPLALVAFFSPIDQLKKLAKEWWENFSSLAFFYPIFIFALILVGRVSSAFSAAANSNIKKLTNTANGLDANGVLVNAQGTDQGTAQLVTTLALYVAVAFASVYMLGLLTSNYKKMLDAIKAGIKSATSAIGNVVSKVGDAGRLGAMAAGAVAPGIAGKLRLQERLAGLKDELRYSSRTAKIEARANSLPAGAMKTSLNNIVAQRRANAAVNLKAMADKRAAKFAAGRTALKDKFEGWGNNFERWTNKDWTEGAKGILGASEAAKKARIAGYKESDRFRNEVRMRKAGFSEQADLIYGNKAKLRGLDASDIAGFEKANPNWVRDKSKEYEKLAYDKSLGNDAKIPRSKLASKGIKLADKAKGKLSNLSASEQSQFVDYVKDGIEIGDVRQQFIGSKNMTSLIQEAMDSDNVLDSGLKDRVKKVVPVFVGNQAERNAAVRKSASSAEALKEMDGSWLAAHPEEAKEFYDTRVGIVGKEKATEEMVQYAGLKGGFSQFVDSTVKKDILTGMGVDLNSEAGKAFAEKTDAALRGSSSKIDEAYLVGKIIEDKNANNGVFNPADYSRHLESYMKKNIGASTVAEAKDKNAIAANLNLPVGSTDAQIIDAIKNNGQFKGVNVSGANDAETLKIYQAAMARNVENLTQTKEVMKDQYARVADQIYDAKSKANNESTLEVEARKEMKDLELRLRSNTVTNITERDVQKQAALELMKDKIDDIKTGEVTVGGTVMNLDLTTSAQKDLIKGLRKYAAASPADRATEHAALVAKYSGNAAATSYINDINSNFTIERDNKSTEIVDKARSKATTSGGGVSASKLAEFARTITLENSRAIESANKKALDGLPNAVKEVELIFNKAKPN